MRNVLTVVAAVVGVLGFANFFVQVVPLYVSHPLAMVAMGFLVIRRIAPAKVLRPTDPPPPLTGPALATARCSGAVASLRVQNMLRVTAYADRIVVTLSLMGTRTVMADQLTRVVPLDPSAVRVEHAAHGLASPVVLALRDGHPLRRALLWVGEYR